MSYLYYCAYCCASSWGIEPSSYHDRARMYLAGSTLVYVILLVFTFVTPFISDEHLLGRIVLIVGILCWIATEVYFTKVAKGAEIVAYYSQKRVTKLNFDTWAGNLYFAVGIILVLIRGAIKAQYNI
jgi:hypothetical protein